MTPRDKLRWLCLVPLPLAAVAVLYAVAMLLPDAIAAARHEGRTGTFMPVSEKCSGPHNSECTIRGNFVSDDGVVVLQDVAIVGSIEHPDQGVRAQHIDGSKKVFTFDSKEWLYGVGFLVAAVGYLIGWGAYVIRRYLKRGRAA